jgi:hypothetical protein
MEIVEKSTLRRSILDDLLKDFDNSRCWIRTILEPIIWLPVDRFADICARFDATVARDGFRAAMLELLADVASEVSYDGLEYVPLEGPLLIVSNHPGTYDSLAITAGLPRDDLQIIATGYPLLRQLPNAQRHLIFTNPHGGANVSVARSAVRHLQSGGAVLIFPSGRVEPDPAVLPGALEALRAGSPSVELFLRRVPQTQTQIAIVSGVLSPVFLHNPLIKLWEGLRDPQMIAEVTQILVQMVLSKWVQLTPHITFDLPTTVDELLREGQSLYQSLVDRAHRLLDDHITKRLAQLQLGRYAEIITKERRL